MKFMQKAQSVSLVLTVSGSVWSAMSFSEPLECVARSMHFELRYGSEDVGTWNNLLRNIKRNINQPLP